MVFTWVCVVGTNTTDTVLMTLTLKFTSEGHEYVEFSQVRGTKTTSGEGEAHQQ